MHKSLLIFFFIDTRPSRYLHFHAKIFIFNRINKLPPHVQYLTSMRHSIAAGWVDFCDNLHVCLPFPQNNNPFSHSECLCPHLIYVISAINNGSCDILRHTTNLVCEHMNVLFDIQLDYSYSWFNLLCATAVAVAAMMLFGDQQPKKI